LNTYYLYGHVLRVRIISVFFFCFVFFLNVTKVAIIHRKI
jgi:hypothetical protein